MPNGDQTWGLVRRLDAAPPFAMLDIIRDHLREHVGAVEVHLWLADYETASLELLRLDDRPMPSLPIASEAHGKAYREQQPQVMQTSPHVVRIYAPATVRAARTGVLEAVVEDHLPEAVAIIEEAATAVAYVVQVARRYTDVFERCRRRQQLELPAEIQWELLPVLAHDGPQFCIAGSLEPAYDIGGDSFDYAVDPGGITVAITDAMGHGTRAAMVSALTVSATRNARRRGDGPRQQVRAANTAVHDQFAGEMFVTGMLMRVERETGEAVAINAGHSLCYRVRNGRGESLQLPADVPMGLFPDTEYEPQHLYIARGDRLVWVSDGVLDAESDGEAFGEGRLIEHLEATASLRPAEVVRTLTDAVMQHRSSHLADDATAVCLDFLPSPRPSGAT